MDLAGIVISVVKTITPFLKKVFPKRNFFKQPPMKQFEALGWLFSEPFSRNPVIRHCQHLKLKSYGFPNDITLSRKVIMHYINNREDYKYCNSIFSMQGGYDIINGKITPKKEKAGTLTILFLIWLISIILFFFLLTHGIHYYFSFEVKFVMVGTLLVFFCYTAMFYIYISSNQKLKYISTILNEKDEQFSLLFNRSWASYVRRNFP